VRYLVLLLSLLAFSACSVEASKTPKRVAQDIADNITYVRDARTGLCFAVISARRTGSVSTTGLGLAQVPCDKLKP
jgi:hypothetical protein